MRCRQSILKKSETEIDRLMTNESKALPSQDSLAGTRSANAMFPTIRGCNRGVTTGRGTAIRRALVNEQE